MQFLTAHFTCRNIACSQEQIHNSACNICTDYYLLFPLFALLQVQLWEAGITFSIIIVILSLRFWPDFSVSAFCCWQTETMFFLLATASVTAGDILAQLTLVRHLAWHWWCYNHLFPYSAVSWLNHGSVNNCRVKSYYFRSSWPLFVLRTIPLSHLVKR